MITIVGLLAVSRVFLCENLLLDFTHMSYIYIVLWNCANFENYIFVCTCKYLCLLMDGYARSSPLGISEHHFPDLV